MLIDHNADEGFIHRRKKGFSSPFIEWMYDGFGTSILTTMIEVNKELDLFNNNFIHFLYEQGQAGHFKQHVYSLYLFSHWYKKNYM